MDDRLAATYDDFGRRWAAGTSPLYAEWAIGIGADPEVVELISALPPRKRQPNLVFASARWEGAPLAGYPEWRDWLIAHWDAVAATASARATQTNEVARTATLLPALARIEGPLALLETGTAAGLCLYPDRYSYRYSAPSGIRSLHPAAGPSAVTLPCRIDADAAVPERVPDVVWRRGIDLNPIDPSDPSAVAWLANLVWPGPDHDGRVERLRGAAEIVAADPPHIVRGDILDRLTDAAADSPAGATLVVFHSAVLLYVDAEGRRRFADLVRGLGDAIGRRVVWIANESTGTLPEIDERLPADLDVAQRFVQSVDGIPVALAGQHGAVFETAAFPDRW